MPPFPSIFPLNVSVDLVVYRKAPIAALKCTPPHTLKYRFHAEVLAWLIFNLDLYERCLFPVFCDLSDCREITRRVSISLIYTKVNKASANENKNVATTLCTAKTPNAFKSFFCNNCQSDHNYEYDRYPLNEGGHFYKKNRL